MPFFPDCWLSCSLTLLFAASVICASPPPPDPLPSDVGHGGISLRSPGMPPVRGVALLKANLGILLQAHRDPVHSRAAETQTSNHMWKSCAKILGHMGGQVDRMIPVPKKVRRLELESHHRVETLPRRIWCSGQKQISQMGTGRTLW